MYINVAGLAARDLAWLIPRSWSQSNKLSYASSS